MMNGGLKLLIGITILASIVLLLALLKLIPLSDSGTSFVEGVIAGGGGATVISWLALRGKRWNASRD